MTDDELKTLADALDEQKTRERGTVFERQIEQLTHSWKQASENHVSYNEYTEWKASVELRFKELAHEEKIHLQKHID